MLLNAFPQFYGANVDQSGRFVSTPRKDMLKSKWADQVGPREKRLAEQMRTGEWL